MSNAISSFDEPQFLQPRVPNSPKIICSSIKSNGSCDSGAETSDSSDDKNGADYLRCFMCHYFTNELSFYVYHLKKVHSMENLQCHNCHVSLNIDNYQKHLIKCKGAFKCDSCGTTFAQKSYLQRHISRVHSKTNNKFICEICGQILSSNYNLKQHKLIHSDTNQYECEFCNKGFIQKIHYNTHLDTHHSKRELVNVKKQFICCVCSQQFMFQTTLQNHMNQYCCKKEKKYVCSTCSKSFLYPSELRRHETIHIDKRQIQTQSSNACRQFKCYQCPRCTKTYYRLYQFLEHFLFFHENINSAFKCPKCNSVFPEIASLKKHYKRHFLSFNHNNHYQHQINNNNDHDKLVLFERYHDNETNKLDSEECKDDIVMLMDESSEDISNNNGMEIDEKVEDTLLIDHFINEIWGKFEQFKDDSNFQDISLDELKWDILQDFID